MSPTLEPLLVEAHPDGSVTFRGAAVWQAHELVVPGVKAGRANGITPTPLVLDIVRSLEDGTRIVRSGAAVQPVAPPSETMTSTELAELLGVVPRTARRLAARWGCPRFGRDYSIDRALAEEELARRRDVRMRTRLHTRPSSSAT